MARRRGRIEDALEVCRVCRLEVPWGTCDADGRCFECAEREQEARMQ